MRIVKILLVLVFAVVAVFYTMNDHSKQNSAADSGPVITCDSETLNISVSDGEQALLRGIAATDEQDGDLSSQVLVSGISKLISDNTAKVTYVVFDSDDNLATLTCNVHYTDYQRPRFSLDEPLLYAADEEIVLLDRLHATDVIDGDITNSIRVSYTQTTSDPEIVTVDVQVINSMGDNARLTLPMIIVESGGLRPVVNLSTYLLYLEQGDPFYAGDYLESATYGNDRLSSLNTTISGQVDTDTPGTYTVTYTSSYNGSSGCAILTVVVE